MCGLLKHAYWCAKFRYDPIARVHCRVSKRKHGKLIIVILSVFDCMRLEYEQADTVSARRYGCREQIGQ